jgi:hypothetical protein
MAKSGKNNVEIEEIVLLRGGSIISSLVGAFGNSLKETRLTALLAYLIALEPSPFMEKFGFKGFIRSVSLENRHEQGRSDILVETTHGTGIVEAKIGGTNPYKQAMKYGAKWRVLLSQYKPAEKEKRLTNIRHIHWHDVVEILKRLSKSLNPKVKFVSQDLLGYMEEHNMIKTRDSVEVYAREINEPNTLVLFLKARLYGCDYKRNSRLSEALYFAPHFGKKICDNYPGVQYGISYIAKVETVDTVETREDLLNIIKAVRGKHWLNSNKQFIKPILNKWKWGNGNQHNFLFLHKPQLVFNPPVRKENLQKGFGWLSKNFLSFDELFSAWNGIKP